MAHRIRRWSMTFSSILLAAGATNAATGSGALVDLNAAVIVTPREATRPEEKAIEMLLDEVE